MYLARTRRALRNALIDGKYSNYSQNVENRMAELYSEFGNTPYWEQFMSNPYLRLPSYFNKDAITLGMVDYYHDMFNNYELQALTEMQRLQRLAYEEHYNTPLEQVKREQEAGLNPNLSGNIDSGAAAEGTELPTPTLPSLVDFRSTQFQRGMGLFDAGQQFLGAFFQIAQNVQGLKMGNIQVADSELGLLGKSNNNVLDYIAEHMPVLDGEDEAQPEVFKQFFDSLSKDFDYSPYSRKTRKFLKSAFSFNNMNPNSIGFQGRYKKGSKNAVSDTWDLAQLIGKKGFDSDFGQMLSNVVTDYSELSYNVWRSGMDLQQKMSDFQNKVYQGYEVNNTAETQANLQSEQLKNELNYQKRLNELNVPERRAESDSSTLDIKALQDEITKFRTSAIKEAEAEFDRIMKTYLNGDKWYHTVGKLALPVLRALVTQSIMSYANSASQHLAQMQFGAQPVAPVTYDYSDRNTTIYNNPIAE